MASRVCQWRTLCLLYIIYIEEDGIAGSCLCEPAIIMKISFLPSIIIHQSPRFLPIHIVFWPEDSSLLPCTTPVFVMYYSGTRHVLLRYSAQVLE